MQYLLLYAKMSDDKKMGFLMTGIYFGGLYETLAQADEVARQCVATTQGGTAIPKIGKFDGGDLRKLVGEMCGTFERMADRMYENEQTIAR